MLYSKNGSIPKTEISGDKEGWIEVSDPPEVPEGKELVWWYPPGWVIRDPKPAATETTDWSWSQSQEQWIEYTINSELIVADEIVIQDNSASPTFDVGSATSTI